MKSYRQLYPQVITWYNLYAAWRKARKGKRGRVPAATFEYYLEDNLLGLQAELTNMTYQPGAYHSFYIHEPKRRLISAAPFHDRVVHHALCNIIEPIFERSFIHDSYANRVGKGSHRALERTRQYSRRCYIPGAPEQPLYSPPNPGNGFEIDLNVYNNILTDETTGSRYIYLDVQTIWGASENGFEVWAGPPNYTGNVSANVNVRNVQIVNEPGIHNSKGATVFGMGRLPMNSNYNNRVSIPLIYVGPEFAGETIYVSMFDPDAGAKPPIDFYFDSIPFADYHITYGEANDPDGRCFDGGNSYDNECNNHWVTPDFIVPIPDLTNDPICQVDPDNNLDICTPFYGGRLMARYKGGQNDTYSWRIILTGLPYLIH